MLAAHEAKGQQRPSVFERSLIWLLKLRVPSVVGVFLIRAIDFMRSIFSVLQPPRVKQVRTFSSAPSKDAKQA